MANKKPDTLYDLFHNAYLKYPNNIAVIHDCVKLKYVVLMSEIKKLSESLGQFCQNCTYIGICIKSLHLAPTVILGIMRLHKAYVVLEDEAAGRRLGWLGCAWVVAEQNCWVGRGSELHSQLQLHEVILGLWAVQGVMPLLVDGVALAYAVHTSGTTGQPKVVQVPHAAILPNITDIQHVLQLTERDVVLLAAPLTFDPSVVEMFLALSSGAAVQVVACGSPLSLLQSITVLQVTPSTLCCWLGVHGVVPAGLRVLLLGGEPCPPLAVLRRWMGGRANCRVFNVYGVTEVSCWASLQEVCWGGHAAGVPLGCPLSSTVLSVRNHAGQAVTQGEGEMYVGSLERTCFVDDEDVHVPTVTVFRATGDIVQVDAESGICHYVGRKDRIIKRWGYRVDIAAVEQEIHMWQPDAECRCVWDDQSTTLGLFLLDGDWRACEARWHLVRHLPPTALPDVIKVLRSWPLTTHGKMDETALKCLLQESSPPNCHKKRRGDVEETFAALCHKYLGLQEPHATDSFIHSGGNSFLALQMCAELEKLSGRPGPPRLVTMLLGGATFLECNNYLAMERHSPSSEDQLEATVLQLEASPLAGDTYHVNADGDCSHTLRTVEPQKLLNSRVGCEYSDDSSERLWVSSCRGRMTTYCEVDSDSGQRGVASGHATLHVHWKYHLGKCVDASPVAAYYSSGRVLVVVGSHSHRLAALDGETGCTIWQVDLPDRIESSVCLSPCGTYGVVGCYDGGVYCMQLGSGVQCWVFRTGQMVKSSPSLCKAGSAIVVGSYDRHLYCLRIKDGAECWRARLGGAVLASPLLEPHSGLIVAAALDGSCAALAQEDGRLCWEHQLACPVFASPALLPAGRVLLAEVTGTLHCFVAISGQQLWTLTLGGHVFSSPCVLEDGTLLQGCHDTSVYCVDGVGAIRWRTTLDSAVVATPCFLPDTKVAVVAASSGRLYLLVLQSGEEHCCQPLPHQVFSSPASCQPHRVYVGCRDDHLYCLAVQ